MIRPIKQVSTPPKAASPKQLQTVSVLSQDSRLVPFAEQDYRNTRHQPCNHIVDTENVVELTPFRAAASSDGALPTPSYFSERFPLLSGDVAQKTS